MSLSANQSSSLLFTNAFDSVLTRISEIARDFGRLSANHVASYIDVLLGRNEHGSSHGICLSTGKFKIS